MLAGAALALGLGPGQAQAADLLFQAEAQTLVGACAGQAVRLEGNHDTVTLSGTCGSLLVKGVGNAVQLTIAGGGSIRVEGSANHIRFTTAGATPTIETFGPDNEVTTSGPTRQISAAPSAPSVSTSAPPVTAGKGGPLELSGDDQDRLADCAGRDLVVTGSRSAYVVRGTCHSLVVRGDLLTVQAVVQSGARIAVTGRGSVVSWAVPAKGRPPVSVVHGAGSRVQRAEAIGGEPVR